MIANSALIYSAQSNKQKYTCICCRIKFEEASLQRAHFKSEWHLYNLRRKVCSLDPIDLESFACIQAASANQARRDDDELSVLSSELSFINLSIKDGQRARGQFDSDTDNDDGDDEFEDFVKIENGDFVDHNELREFFGSMVQPDTCLFCAKKSSSRATNLEHMNLNHGFFIPEERYLIDLEGLMEYLGLKVGAGVFCLWCNKQFNSLHGVRLHMVHKDHCKIMFDQDSATGEFKEFYDYSTRTEIAQKPASELVAIKKSRFIRRSRAHSGPLEVLGSAGVSPSSSFEEDKGLRGGLEPDLRKFGERRAKILLKTSKANNYTLRARMRLQNPA